MFLVVLCGRGVCRSRVCSYRVNIEKSKKIIEGMLMMGLRPIVFYLSWGITYMVITFGITILIVVCLHANCPSLPSSPSHLTSTLDNAPRVKNLPNRKPISRLALILHIRSIDYSPRNVCLDILLKREFGRNFGPGVFDCCYRFVFAHQGNIIPLAKHFAKRF